FLTFGTGFGAGIVIDGKLYTGTNDMAGEIGHIRLTEDGPVGYGKAGSAEGYCSGGGIKNLAALFGINATAKELAHSAENGDKDAVKIYETSGKYLGRTAAVIMDIFNPDCIVIGSVFARSEKLLRPAMEAEIEKEALSYTRSCCKIVPALLGDSIGDCAAIMTAAYGFENQNK
ncbi:MAG: ROK family protein, partial [Clostridia bacterium]|nr:ROK family protein [Clostridia bacterium]